jgi:hypothetical protein
MRPVTFVREASTEQDAGNMGVKKTASNKGGKQSYRVWSSSGVCYSDVGDNHSLCDKECGWCGHCADNVYICWF